MQKQSLVVVFGLLALGLVGWLLWTNGGDADGVAPLVTPTPVAVAPTPAAPAAVASGDLAAAAHASAAQPAGLERLAASPPVATATTGSVLVRGRLVDRHGAPRPGLELTLASWRSAADELLDFDPGTRGTVGAPALPRHRSGADGRFEIPLAADHSGSLALAADGLLFAKDPPRLRGKRGDQDLGDLRVLRGGEVRGVVRDQAGKPIAGVKVAATQGVLGIGGISEGVTAADGTFTIGMLRPATWTLRTLSARYLPTVVELTFGDEEQKEGVVLTLLPGNAIAGQVVDERGVGVAAIKVGGQRKELRGGFDIELFTAAEATTTDPNGYFQLAGLADETVTVRAYGPDHSTAVANDVAVGTGDLLLRVERLGSIEGILVATDGTPIAGSRVAASAAGAVAEEPGLQLVEDADIGMVGAAASETAADGTFRLTGVRPGAMTVTAIGKLHRPARQAGVMVVSAQATTGIRLVADAGAIAKLRVVDDAGEPVADARVTLRRPSNPAGGGSVRLAARAMLGGDVAFDSMDSLAKGTSDAQGLVTLAGLPAGEVEATATHATLAPAKPVRLSLPKSGAVEGTMVMPPGAFVEVLALANDGTPLVDAGVQLEPVGVDGATELTGTTDSNGLVRLGPLSAGVYAGLLTRVADPTNLGGTRFVFGGAKPTIAASRREVTAAAGQTVRLELRRPVLTRLHGIVTGAGGPIAGCDIELSQVGAPGLPRLPGVPGLPGEDASRSTTSAADGSFELADVESGSWEVRFGKAGQLAKASILLDVPPGVAELRQDLQLRTGKLTARLVAAGSGEPVAGADVELARPSASGRTAGGRQERRVMMISFSTIGDQSGETTRMTNGAPRVRSDADGLVEIDDVPVGEWELRVRHKKFAPKTSSPQQVGEQQVVDAGRIELTAGGTVRGKVLMADGKPPRMALVSHRVVGTTDWSEPAQAMGGSYRVPGLAPGRYQFRAVEIRLNAGEAPEMEPVEVEVKAGETIEAELRLPAK